MQSWETSTIVEGEGQISVGGVPFAPGTEVEVMVSPKRKSADEFAAAWQRVCRELRDAAGSSEFSDEEIQNEINAFRSQE